jgi:hypothetical protein
VPRIIDDATFEAAQATIKRNRRTAKRNLKYNYLIGKRVVCACGLRMHGARKVNRQGRVYFYYRCPASRGGKQYTYGHKCRAPYFRADHVDAAIWAHIQEYRETPKKLWAGAKKRQAEREKEDAPLRERLTVIKDLIAENQKQLERLLDLYLSGDFPREMLTERKNRLEMTIEALEREQVTLVASLEQRTITDEQIESVERFIAKAAECVARAEDDFEAQRHVLEMMDTEVTLTVEDEQKIAHFRGIAGDKKLPVVPMRSDGGSVAIPRRCSTSKG